MTALLWFRRDLRLGDQPALGAAAVHGPVLPVYVLDPEHEPAGELPRRRRDRSLASLHAATDGALVVRAGESAHVIAELAEEAGAREVHATAAATPQRQERDSAVTALLARDDRRLVVSGSDYAVPPGTLLTEKGTPYQVFGPFARAWRERVIAAPLEPPAVRWQRGVPGEGVPEASAGPDVAGSAESPEAGESAAWARWEEFLDCDVAGYADQCDRPDLDRTSRLSAALAWGEVHPRQLLASVSAVPTAARAGAQRFVNELCWREFCADVLWHNPDSAWADLRPWPHPLRQDPEGPDVQAWRDGRTGYPLIDAGMRQLAQTGWLHNRVRMAVASFLVKDLHATWQLGARHFLDLLVDGDLASNTHNWQWVAGTGTDAAPYFRVFNPVRQGLRFDPDGRYVRRWVPELGHLPGAAAHEPWRQPDGHAGGYPRRIVDHDEERREALARYAHAKGQA